MVQNFFLYFEDFWVINFWTKIVYFITISKNIISPVWIKKIFFLWKLLVALIILQKTFCQKLPSLIRFWHSELHTEFQPLKILHFSFKISTKLRKFTCLKIRLIFRSSYDYQCTHYFPKTFLQNNQCNEEFSQKKIFFNTKWRNDIFWYGKKIHDFCSKINNSKYLQNIKKIFTPRKSSTS